ncbi:hypothetical protein SLAV_39375 [Streptomyces lavendulae subsp. lavendulae]|uniref:Uncharacterized protein n=1 Tax=Streptomyces lavendulae subsp. lavendulae TaxID=58340 RepID=A0A2K8PT34_STRLA|nr:hypothetical protein [Streptomyces lavendulae]ATZ21933.1 hypothetical protein SLAV_00015 [Streptomyces lavendulae subsp. lavendulae]ATZ29638.1 hypothetical protein SLAV_39375 [Streptomyces lavendulae subsp. lavendulae]
MIQNDSSGYRIGEADRDCRWAVLTSDGEQIGRIFRWHGAWFALPAGATDATRQGDGGDGSESAARYLFAEYQAGRITPQPETPSQPQARDDAVPLLHPGMRDNDRTRSAARTAVAGLDAYRWAPLAGYPGSDNPWPVRCQLCGWEGNRYWSHLRGRNGNPPSPYRHPGCIDADKVRAVIPAYTRSPQN